MKTLNIGIVGFGGRGAYLGREAEETSGGLMKITAVVEPDDNQFEKSCLEYPTACKPIRYTGVKKMLSGENLALVIIASPNENHLENLREMAGCNIPVLLEKPLDSSWDKINDIVRFSKRYPAPIVVGHCMRYAPILNKAKELISQGAIGRVCSARFVQYCHYGNSMFHNWRREKKHSGGFMIEKATHDLDAMNWLLESSPVSVFSSAKQMVFGGTESPELRCRDCGKQISCLESPANTMHRWVGSYKFEEIKRMDDLCVFSKVVDVPDDEICLIQFENGNHAVYNQVFYSPRAFHHRDYQIIGDMGALDVDLGSEAGGKIILCPRYGTPSERAEYNYDYLMRNHYNGDGVMVRHLYDVATGKARPKTTIAQAYIAEAVGYASTLSAESNRAVNIRELIPDDLTDVLENVRFSE